MNRGMLIKGMALAVTLAVPLAACAGKFRISAATMCQGHGGTYNATTQTCSYTQSTRRADQNCILNGGYYDPAAQMCEFESGAGAGGR